MVFIYHVFCTDFAQFTAILVCYFLGIWELSTYKLQNNQRTAARACRLASTVFFVQFMEIEQYVFRILEDFVAVVAQLSKIKSAQRYLL